MPVEVETVHGRFEDQVVRSGEALAVVSSAEELSYAELNSRANRVARYLRGLGVGPEVLVGVVVERSAAMVPALLGVLKAGGGYVPVDPSYPADRIGLILADSRPAVVLTQESLLAGLPSTDATVVCLDRDAAVIGLESGDDLGPTAGPLNLAYVVYTSGSTGRPKGVAVPHAGVCNLARGQQEFLGLGPGDRVLQFAALGFDAAVCELTMALLYGAAVYVPSETRRRWRLPAVLGESGATIVTLPPSSLAALVASPTPEAFPALRQLLVAGEECPPSLARAWAPGRRLFNAYGPTETSVCATMWQVEELAADAVRVPIGGPISGVSVYVLGAGLEPAAEGELYIGGKGVARGYLSQPALTAARFLPDPFSATPGARMYRSGDLVRVDDDGRLEFLGRVDDQVKIRGYRIEPAEIEAALASCEGIREAVVLAIGEGEQLRLSAFLVREPGAAPEEDELRHQLLDLLPEAMIPTDYVVLDAFPRTPNQKVDRKQLRALVDPAGREPSRTEPSVGDDIDYRVVANDDEQFSIWPADHADPAGWRTVGDSASLADCLTRVSELWHDLRPHSLRDHHAQAASTAT